MIAEADDKARVLRGLDIGVHDFLVRPVDRNELVARVRTQVRRKRFSDSLRSTVQTSMELAITDPLTGLHNRRYLDSHLGALFDEAASRGQARSRCFSSTSTASSRSTTPTATTRATRCCASSRCGSGPTPAASTSSPATAARSSSSPARHGGRRRRGHRRAHPRAHRGDAVPDPPRHAGDPGDGLDRRRGPRGRRHRGRRDAEARRSCPLPGKAAGPEPGDRSRGVTPLPLAGEAESRSDRVRAGRLKLNINNQLSPPGGPCPIVPDGPGCTLRSTASVRHRPRPTPALRVLRSAASPGYFVG